MCIRDRPYKYTDPECENKEGPPKQVKFLHVFSCYIQKLSFSYFANVLGWMKPLPAALRHEPGLMYSFSAGLTMQLHFWKIEENYRHGYFIYVNNNDCTTYRNIWSLHVSRDVNLRFTSDVSQFLRFSTRETSISQQYNTEISIPVSYTHLTLPTIYSV